MSLDQETVRRIAFLARIRIPEEQIAGLAHELSGILQWVEQLGEVDTSGVEPMTSVADMTLPFRQDDVSDGGAPEAVLANAPDRAGDFFAVPKVVE
jgi:aspartyl-tRNA(Asn)/glutamyl-tRNA(Gln) amidotransferase subunit C